MRSMTLKDDVLALVKYVADYQDGSGESERATRLMERLSAGETLCDHHPAAMRKSEAVQITAAHPDAEFKVPDPWWREPKNVAPEKRAEWRRLMEMALAGMGEEDP